MIQVQSLIGAITSLPITTTITTHILPKPSLLFMKSNFAGQSRHHHIYLCTSHIFLFDFLKLQSWLLVLTFGYFHFPFCSVLGLEVRPRPVSQAAWPCRALISPGQIGSQPLQKAQTVQFWALKYFFAWLFLAQFLFFSNYRYLIVRNSTSSWKLT